MLDGFSFPIIVEHVEWLILTGVYNIKFINQQIYLAMWPCTVIITFGFGNIAYVSKYFVFTIY